MNNTAKTDFFILRSTVPLGCTTYFKLQWILYNGNILIEPFSLSTQVCESVCPCYVSEVDRKVMKLGC